MATQHKNHWLMTSEPSECSIDDALAAKKAIPASAGTFPTHGPLFVGLLIGTVLVLGGLTFFPALALGPVVEHLQLVAGRTF